MAVASPLTQLDRVLGFGSRLARSQHKERTKRTTRERKPETPREFDRLKFGKELHRDEMH